MNGLRLSDVEKVGRRLNLNRVRECPFVPLGGRERESGNPEPLEREEDDSVGGDDDDEISSALLDHSFNVSTNQGRIYLPG